MLRSMTGFGRADNLINGRQISIEIRAVNHRYFEFSLRAPRNYTFLEESVRRALAEKITRGKVEVSITARAVEVADTTVELNMLLVKSYEKAFRELSTELGTEYDITPSMYATLPDVLRLNRAEIDEEQLQKDVLSLLDEATSALIFMREQEGARLLNDITGRLSVIGATAKEIEDNDGARQSEHREKLYARMKAILEDVQVDEARLLNEVAIFADKTAVSEETVRIASHIEQFCEIMETGQPVGRKLDFLVQELNREVNTLGSKISDSVVTLKVVDMKSELEKIREQIQNVE